MHKLDNQADAIKRAVETVAKFTGKPPRSWESPGLTETEETLDLLRLNGIEYVADWVIDDLPQDIATPHGTITTIPYTVETNDIVVHALQHLPSDQFLKRGIDQFDCVAPTRLGRHGQVYTPEGRLHVSRPDLKDDPRPIQAEFLGSPLTRLCWSR